MSAKHAVLGLLLDRPAYAYELGDQLKQRLGPAWSMNSGQLYRLVKRLEQDGLIEPVEESVDRRRRLAINGAGEAEFERWFAESAEVRLPRRPLLVKLTLAGPRRLPDALEEVELYERRCAGMLDELVRRHAEIPPDGPLVRADHLLLRLNLSADIAHLEGELAWARHAREMMSWLSSREAVWPSARDRVVEQRERDLRQGARRELFARLASSDQEPQGRSGRPEDVDGD